MENVRVRAWGLYEWQSLRNTILRSVNHQAQPIFFIDLLKVTHLRIVSEAQSSHRPTRPQSRCLPPPVRRDFVAASCYSQLRHYASLRRRRRQMEKQGKLAVEGKKGISEMQFVIITME